MSSRNLNGGTDGSTSSYSDGSTSNESCSNNNTYNTFNIVNNIHPFSQKVLFPTNNQFNPSQQVSVQINSIDESEKKFVRYQMQVTYNGTIWYLSRRFSEFHTLLDVVSIVWGYFRWFSNSRFFYWSWGKNTPIHLSSSHRRKCSLSSFPVNSSSLAFKGSICSWIK